MSLDTDDLGLWVRPDEQCVALTGRAGANEGAAPPTFTARGPGEYRLIQPLKGHTYSVDDMLVAHAACTAFTDGRRPSRVLDLGCGLASVLLMVAWAHPQAAMVGLEAQVGLFEIARRNLDLNGCAARAEIHLGDLRDDVLVTSLGPFDLVTATPPYFDPRRATPCADPLRAHAHFELRGGVEEYARAAALAASPRGVFVLCAAAEPKDRGINAIRDAGFGAIWRRRVIPRTGRAPWLELLAGTLNAPDSIEEAAPLVLRDTQGRRSPEHMVIRQWFGVPCSEA